MKHLIQKTTRIGLSLFLLAVLMAGALALSNARSARALSQTTTIRSDSWFDLETGTVTVGCIFCSIPPQADFLFEYDNFSLPHTFVKPNSSYGARIAYSAETYDNVQFNDVASLTFTTGTLHFNKVVVVRTGGGNYFKIGLVSESGGFITFQWEQLTPTPQDAIEDLQGDIQSLVDDGTLKTGQANGLIHPLDNAIRSLDKGHTDDACNQLDDFIAEVNEKTPTPLDAATAADLIASAEEIKTSIGCE